MQKVDECSQLLQPENSTYNVLTIKLGSHQVDSQDLIGSRQTTAVNLTILKRSRLQKLFKHDAVLTVFTSCNANTIRMQCLKTNSRIINWQASKKMHSISQQQTHYKYVGPTCSRTKIYVTCMSCGSSRCWSISTAQAWPQQQTHQPPLLLSIPGRERWTDRQIFDRFTAVKSRHAYRGDLCMTQYIIRGCGFLDPL